MIILRYGQETATMRGCFERISFDGNCQAKGMHIADKICQKFNWCRIIGVFSCNDKVERSSQDIFIGHNSGLEAERHSTMGRLDEIYGIYWEYMDSFFRQDGLAVMRMSETQVCIYRMTVSFRTLLNGIFD